MSYENAASTKMLASHCAFCARPLRDAQSVESGVGPICRRRYMVADRVDEQARKEGNKLIHTIAKHQNGPGVEKALERLSELGFTNVVKRIRKRIKKHSVQKVELFYRSGRLHLRVPFMGRDRFRLYLNAVKAIKGRRFDKQEKTWTFPPEQRASVWGVLQRFFSGQSAIGPKGEFVIG